MGIVSLSLTANGMGFARYPFAYGGAPLSRRLRLSLVLRTTNHINKAAVEPPLTLALAHAYAQGDFATHSTSTVKD